MADLYIIAGCNGAGKTTASFTLLPDVLGINEFVNADEIARGLSPFRPESVAVEAGRIMLNRIRELMEANTDFAFETTLAARSYVSLIRDARRKGYQIHLIFFWLESVEEAIMRVALRVKNGGHSIPEVDVRRRYNSGLNNFFKLYTSTVDRWMFFNNTTEPPVLIAYNNYGTEVVENSDLWKLIQMK